MHAYAVREGAWVAEKWRTSCYSGAGEGRNNPLFDGQADVGPIPTGVWVIVDEPAHQGLAAPIFRLHPGVLTQTHGRSGFLVHGDNISHDASKGCIIMGHEARLRLQASHDRLLYVYNDLAEMKCEPFVPEHRDFALRAKVAGLL